MVRAIVLSAGYATRLYPLTENFPKQLLPLNNKPLLEYIIDKVSEIPSLSEIVIVSNNKFFNHFHEWRNQYQTDISIRILNDGSTSNENRLGALKDLLFAIESENINENILVIAGDNLIEFSLKNFYNKFKEFDKNLIAVYDIEDIEKVRGRHGVAVLQGNQVIDFQEKPLEPRSTMKSICCYFFKPDIKGLLGEYLEEGNPDATGFFLEWLVKRVPVFAYQFNEKVYDIGNLESYKEADRVFSGKA